MRILAQSVISVLVFCATAIAVWFGGALPELLGYRWCQQHDAMIFIGLVILTAGVVWSSLTGILCAWAWKRRYGFLWQAGFVLACVAFLFVFALSCVLLKNRIFGAPIWKYDVGVLGQITVLLSLSVFPSQVAFWGFALVARIGGRGTAMNRRSR
jgi:hypothetical protein